MTGGFTRLFIMRPQLLHLLLLPALLLTSTVTADSGESPCQVEVRVRRNTVYNASLGDYLRLNCPVIFCNNSPPEVTWFKMETSFVPVDNSSGSHIKKEWKDVNQSVGISYLVFKKILRSDSGVYQCHSKGSISHNINVFVHGNQESHNVTHKNKTISSSDAEPEQEDLMMYVYPAAGIVAFVIIVIIVSVASMRGCKGKSKKDPPADNVYTTVPMSEQPLPRPGLQPSPRQSPSAPPPRRSTRRKRPPTPNGHAYGEVRRTAEQEEEGSVVYVALNHQLPAGGAARPRRPAEESSEYAAIRVKEPTATGH